MSFYDDVRKAYRENAWGAACHHYVNHGQREGRCSVRCPGY